MRHPVLLLVCCFIAFAALRPSQGDNVAHYHGCPVFTAGDWYNAPVTHASIDAHSKEYTESMYDNGDRGGFVVYNVQPAVFKVNIATERTPKMHVRSVAWHQNEFPTAVPWQSDFYVEPLSDGHAIVLNTQTCVLTELYQAKNNDSDLFAYSGWSWNLMKPLSAPSNHQPSSTASGLPLFAGIVKGEEIEAAGPIDHALNFGPPEGSISPDAYVAPAVNNGGCDGCAGPRVFAMPYGAHLRLRSDFTINCSCPQAQRIVTALKTYGAFISDTGSRGTGNALWVALDAAGHNPWDPADLENLEQIHIIDMDVVNLGPIHKR